MGGVSAKLTGPSSNLIASHLSLPPFDIWRQDYLMTNSERSAVNGIALRPERAGDRSKSEVRRRTDHREGPERQQHAMNTPPIVSPQEWKAARQQLLVGRSDDPKALIVSDMMQRS